ncbi:MAG: beta-lactamase family protein [Acidimicrobiales bacterium]|nr:beta-lactamase family protein [Acidimicrobiales bacterium]
MATQHVRDLLDAVVPPLIEQHGVPGVAVGMVHDGEETHAGYGVTSVEDPLPVTDRTLFQVASITKTFTAALVMQQVERRVVELDAPVRLYLPAFSLRSDADAVTVRMLLTHTAGFHGDWFFVHRAPATGRSLEDLLSGLPDAPQLFAPGTAWSYNNAAFSVAGALLEAVTGRRYADLLADELLRPLGMGHSVLTADEAVTRRVAAPHLRLDGTTFVLRGAGWQPGWELPPADGPAGGLVSCTADLAAWARFHLGGGVAPDGTRLLAEATVSAMREPWAATSEVHEHTGAAWFLRPVQGVHTASHGGLTVGYSSRVVLVPERHLALAVLTNAVTGFPVVQAVVRAVLEGALGLDDAPPAPDPSARPADVDELLGWYAGPFWDHEVRRPDGHDDADLVLVTHGRPAVPDVWAPPPLPPVPARFFAPDRVVGESLGEQAWFRRDAAGRVAGLHVGGRLAPRLAREPTDRA